MLAERGSWAINRWREEHRPGPVRPIESDATVGGNLALDWPGGKLPARKVKQIKYKS